MYYDDHISELIAMKAEAERDRDNFFDGDDDPHYGDRGYQDLCERISELEDEIQEAYDDEEGS